MNRHTNKIRNNQYLPAARETPEKQGAKSPVFQFRDNRAQAIAQHTLQAMADNSLRARQLRAFQVIADGGSGIVVQREINQVYLDSDDLVHITRDSDRPQGNLRGHTGDHTTPYVTFDHQIMAAVEGQELQSAWKSLVKTYNLIRTMPGYNESQYVNQFEQLSTILQSINPKAATVDHILLYGNRIIEVRNMLRYTAYPATGGSTGGNNEAVAGGLLEEERRIRKNMQPQYKKSQIMTTMWAIFDHKRMARSIPPIEQPKVLLQHRMSMLDTYWRVVEEYGISDADLQNFYAKYY